MSDNVTRPAHYTSGDIECIDAIRASMSAEEFEGYCKGAVMKYVWRWRQKGGVEDLRKAGVYLGWLVDSAKGSAVTVRRAPFDYPWDQAPDWANGAVRDREGFLVWLEEEPEWDYDAGDFVWPERREVFTADLNFTEEWPNSWRPRLAQHYYMLSGDGKHPPQPQPAHRAEDSKPEEVEPKPDTVYPWHLAPDSAVGATTDADGWVFWWSEKPRIYAQMWVGGLSFQRAKGALPLEGDWRESWRYRPGKEPRP